MTGATGSKARTYLPNFTARKVQALPGGLAADVPDSLAAWATRYLAPMERSIRTRIASREILEDFSTRWAVSGTIRHVTSGLAVFAGTGNAVLSLTS